MKAVNEKSSLHAAQAIASSMKSLLGPSKSTKCCINGVDDGDAIICSNAAKILQYLEVEHPVGYIINDACQAMHKAIGCGCKTLVCMIGFWSRSALALQHEGVPVSIISQLFDEALVKCIEVLQEAAIPIQEAINERNKTGSMPSNIADSSPGKSYVCARSLFPFEKIWITSDEVESHTTHESDDCVLKMNTSASFSIGMSDDKSKKYGTERGTKNLMENYPERSRIQNNKKPTTISGQYTFDKVNSSKESLVPQGDEEVEDEFDSCFDSCVSVENSRKNPVSPEADGVCTPLSDKGLNKTKSQKVNKSFDSLKHAKIDQMIKNLSFSGQTLASTKSSTGKNVSEILKSCHNLSIDFPKTQPEKVTHQTQTDSSCQASFDFGIIKKEDFEKLGKMLSHGKDREMELAVEVIYNQMSFFWKKTNFNRFEVDGNAINIEKIIGPTSDHSHVVSGILLRQKAQFLEHLPAGHVHVALVNGDITEDFRHVGFKDSFQTRRIFNDKSYKKLYPDAVSWLDKILNILRTFNIGAVFAKGKIDKDLEESCQASKIQTFSNLSSKILQVLSHALDSRAVIYLLDLKESHIGRPVFLHHWNEPHSITTADDDYFVVLELAENQKSDNATQQSVNKSCRLKENMKECKEDNGLLQTVLLCGPTEQLLMDLELAFWNCAFRLRNTVNCGLVLPGAGRTELACIRKLRELSENPDHLDKPRKNSSWIQLSLQTYRTAVYTAFADGLVEFLVSVLSNSGHMMNYGQVHTVLQEVINDQNQPSSGQYLLVADDFIAKRNAWNRAVGVVRLMLQSDMTVITGTNA